MHLPLRLRKTCSMFVIYRREQIDQNMGTVHLGTHVTAVSVLVVVISFFLCPSLSHAQLTSQNYVVNGSSVSQQGITDQGSSTNYVVDQKSGGTYRIGSTTPTTSTPSSPHSSSGGSRGTVSTSTATATSSVLIGPHTVVVGSTITLTLILKNNHGDIVDDPHAAVDIIVTGANPATLVVTYVQNGMYTASYTAINAGTDIAVAFLNGVQVSNTLDGPESGNLTVAVGVAPISTIAHTPEAQQEGTLSSDPSGSASNRDDKRGEDKNELLDARSSARKPTDIFAQIYDFLTSRVIPWLRQSASPLGVVGITFGSLLALFSLERVPFSITNLM